MAEWHEASLLDLVVLPMIPYLIWALLYYVKVCVHKHLSILKSNCGVVLSGPIPLHRTCLLSSYWGPHPAAYQLERAEMTAVVITVLS